MKGLPAQLESLNPIFLTCSGVGNRFLWYQKSFPWYRKSFPWYRNSFLWYQKSFSWYQKPYSVASEFNSVVSEIVSVVSKIISVVSEIVSVVSEIYFTLPATIKSLVKMREFLNFLAQRLSHHFNKSVQITSKTQVFGGDINQTYHLQTNIGAFFLKLNNGVLKDMFEKEFDGLQRLHQTKTIKIPEPILYGNFSNQIFLVTEFVQKKNPSKNFWQTFAQQLAALHKHSNTQFGLSVNNYIGSLQQQNNFCNTWAEFYATQRIMPLMLLALNQNKCTEQDVQLAEKLCKRLYNLFPEEEPALVHGDLWSGNFTCNENSEPVIYDPAVYYGNREMDIAMSLLFGGFDKSFYDYYNEVFPLQPNWKERVQLCQLYPLLVHLILFGKHYYTSAISVIKRYTNSA